jgi:hypothetical protein
MSRMALGGSWSKKDIAAIIRRHAPPDLLAEMKAAAAELRALSGVYSVAEIEVGADGAGKVKTEISCYINGIGHTYGETMAEAKAAAICTWRSTTNNVQSETVEVRSVAEILADASRVETLATGSDVEVSGG